MIMLLPLLSLVVTCGFHDLTTHQTVTPPAAHNDQTAAAAVADLYKLKDDLDRPTFIGTWQGNSMMLRYNAGGTMAISGLGDGESGKWRVVGRSGSTYKLESDPGLPPTEVTVSDDGRTLTMHGYAKAWVGGTEEGTMVFIRVGN